MASYKPDAGDVHVDALLTQLSIAYRNLTYIADQIFPVVQVEKQSDIVPQYDQSHWFRDQAREWVPGTPLHESGYTVDNTATYFCIGYQIAKLIPDHVRANADQPYDMDRDATEWVTDQLGLRRERAFVADFWKTSVWGTDYTGGTSFTKWSDYGGSDPMTDIRQTARRTLRRKIGRNPTLLVLGDLTRDVLIDHPDFVDRIKYTQEGVVTEALLARLLDVDTVLVGESVYTADEEGTAEASVTYTANWDDDALLLYVPPRPSILTPSAGYTFFWRPLTGGGLQFIRRIRDDKIKVDIIDGQTYFDQKAISTAAGAFFSDAVD